ncbi:MAG: tetratricopeptide repeat protein, partial [Deltaproteobacteria bacterium]|nr:tetratricopeptide repeat protein [Deltaproteobacteria bacterium]
FPNAGTGFGTFESIYPKYQTSPVKGIVDHAHNDYLELFTDGGMISALLVAWFLLSLFVRSFKAFLTRRESFSIYLYLGSITGIVSILFHSSTDFNFHIGANGLYFFFLAGLAVSSANTRLKERLKATRLKKMKRSLAVSISISALIILVAGMDFNIGAIAGEYNFLPYKGRDLNAGISQKELIAMNSAAYKGSGIDPLEPRYHFAAANTDYLLLKNETALEQYKKAIRLNPSNGEYLQQLGFFWADQGNPQTADRLIQAGTQCEISNALRYQRYATWLLARGKVEKGLKNMKTAISLDPDNINEYITLMVLNRLSEEQMREALPKKVAPYLFFAEYLHSIGKEVMAEDIYAHALGLIENEAVIRPSYFYKPYRFYMKTGRYNDALKVIHKAIVFLPNDLGIRLTTADLYKKLGISYRAMEEYQQALMIDPGNQRAKKELDRIRVKQES